MSASRSTHKKTQKTKGEHVTDEFCHDERVNFSRPNSYKYIYIPNNRALKQVKQELTELKEERENNPLSTVNRTTQQKTTKETEA